MVQGLSNGAQGICRTNESLGADEERLRDACQGFEEIYLGIMLKEMGEGIHEMQEDGILEPTHASDMFQAMMYEKVAAHIAHEKGLGFGEILFQQMRQSCKQGNSGR